MGVPVLLYFHPALSPLITSPHNSGRVEYCLSRKASVKDVIESLGIPHTEIAHLTVNGEEKGFDYILVAGDTVEVHAVMTTADVYSPNILRQKMPERIRFVVDVNVGKLARLLRLLGFDAVYHSGFGDETLARIAHEEQRIMLTKDATLLKRKIVQFGRLVRSTTPREQLLEVVELYDLARQARPFSRCLCCNSILEVIPKEEIIDRLQPLTRKYYDSFYICPGCDRLYWAGSHRQGMHCFLQGIL